MTASPRQQGQPGRAVDHRHRQTTDVRRRPSSPGRPRRLRHGCRDVHLEHPCGLHRVPVAATRDDRRVRAPARSLPPRPPTRTTTARPRRPYSITVNKADTVTVTRRARPASPMTARPETPCTRATVTGPGGLTQVLAVGYADNTDAGTATSYTFNTTATPARCGKPQPDRTTRTDVYDGNAHGARAPARGVDGTRPSSPASTWAVSFTRTSRAAPPNWTFTDVTGNYNDDAARRHHDQQGRPGLHDHRLHRRL